MFKCEAAVAFLWCVFLAVSWFEFEVNHVLQLDAIFDDHMVIVVCEEVFYDVGAGEAAAFIEPDCLGIVPCADKEGTASLLGQGFYEVDHDVAITLSLIPRNCRQVLQFHRAWAFFCHDCDGPGFIIKEGVHNTPVEITLNHMHVLISQQEEVLVLELVFFLDFLNAYHV